MRLRVGWLVAAIILAAVSACTSSGAKKTGRSWFEARPLIMPGQHATVVRSNPFGSLSTPTSEDAYNRLSRPQRAELAQALRGVDCAHPPQLSGSDDRVLCDAHSNAFLLGAPLFTGNDVTQAKALPPSASVAGWQVTLMLTSSAAEKMSRWTAQHHAPATSGAFNDVQTSSTPPCGPTATSECSAFTAYIRNTVVVTVPVSFAEVGKTVEFDGEFKQAFATGLARKLAG